MRIRAKLTLGYLLMVGFVALVGILSLQAGRAVVQAYDGIAEDNLPAIENLEKLRFAALRIVASVSEIALIRSERSIVIERSGAASLDQAEDDEGELLSRGGADFEENLEAHAAVVGQSGSGDVAAAHPEPGAPPAAAGVLDPAALATIRSLQQPGAPNLLHKVIGVYLDSSRHLMERLGTSLVAADGTAVAEAAHALKSSSANVGATALAELCRVLESAGRRSDWSEAGGLLHALRNEYAGVVAALAALQERSAA